MSQVSDNQMMFKVLGSGCKKMSDFGRQCSSGLPRGGFRDHG